jgi:hypothetical protein
MGWLKALTILLCQMSGNLPLINGTQDQPNGLSVVRRHVIAC